MSRLFLDFFDKSFLVFYIYRDHRDGDKIKEEKESKPKSVFEQFNIPRPTLQMNPFTGNLTKTTCAF